MLVLNLFLPLLVVGQLSLSIFEETSVRSHSGQLNVVVFSFVTGCRHLEIVEMLSADGTLKWVLQTQRHTVEKKGEWVRPFQQQNSIQSERWWFWSIQNHSLIFFHSLLRVRTLASCCPTLLVSGRSLSKRIRKYRIWNEFELIQVHWTKVR